MVILINWLLTFKMKVALIFLSIKDTKKPMHISRHYPQSFLLSYESPGLDNPKTPSSTVQAAKGLSPSWWASLFSVGHRYSLLQRAARSNFRSSVRTTVTTWRKFFPSYLLSPQRLTPQHELAGVLWGLTRLWVFILVETAPPWDLLLTAFRLLGGSCNAGGTCEQRSKNGRSAPHLHPERSRYYSVVNSIKGPVDWIFSPPPGDGWMGSPRTACSSTRLLLMNPFQTQPWALLLSSESGTEVGDLERKQCRSVRQKPGDRELWNKGPAHLQKQWRWHLSTNTLR